MEKPLILLGKLVGLIFGIWILNGYYSEGNFEWGILFCSIPVTIYFMVIRVDNVSREKGRFWFYYDLIVYLVLTTLILYVTASAVGYFDYHDPYGGYDPFDRF